MLCDNQVLKDSNTGDVHIMGSSDDSDVSMDELSAGSEIEEFIPSIVPKIAKIKIPANILKHNSADENNISEKILKNIFHYLIHIKPL